MCVCQIVFAFLFVFICRTMILPVGGTKVRNQILYIVALSNYMISIVVYFIWTFSVSMADKPETCASTTSSVLSRHFQKKALPLVGGAPCSGSRGYCDKFHVCRLLDADGPIARLKNSFLNLDDFDDIAEWMKVTVSCD